MKKLIEITYNGSLSYIASIKNVIRSFKVNINDEDFLNLENPKNGKRNRDLIFEAYSTQEKIVLGLSDKDGNLIKTADEITTDILCPYPITFHVNYDSIPEDILISQSNVLANNFSVSKATGKNNSFIIDTNKFYKFNIKDSGFDDNRTAFLNDKTVSGEREIIKPRIWIWSKVLNEYGKFNPDSIFDLSPFVESVSVKQTANGGNFDLSLICIDGIFKLDENDEPVGIWSPNQSSYVKFKNSDSDNYFFRNVLEKLKRRQTENYKNETFTEREQDVNINGLEVRDRKFKDGDLDYNRSEIFFKNIISENDVVFISFKDKFVDEPEYKKDFFVNYSDLPNNDWTMIGLVDSNNLSLTYEGTDLSLSVSGTDLMKLLIEDGSYFFAKSFASPDNENTAFDNEDLKNRGDDNNALNMVTQEKGSEGINRLVTTGVIDVLYNREARNVNFIMNLLMSRLSNIEICNSELFKYYGDRRTEFLVPYYETTEETDEDIDENLD